MLWARISVGSFRSAISAHAITVLPLPGGATSTPLSYASMAATAACLQRRQLAVEFERHRLVVGPAIVDARVLPARLDRLLELREQAAWKAKMR